jgi:Na+-transporting methylmalonyl-CoA/oxaloacetate decarboxylase gamma subunit
VVKDKTLTFLGMVMGFLVLAILCASAIVPCIVTVFCGENPFEVIELPVTDVTADD